MPVSVTNVRTSSRLCSLESCKFLQPRVRHLCVAEVQSPQVREAGKFLQPRVRYVRLPEIEDLQGLETGKFLQSRVHYPRFVEVYKDYRLPFCLVVTTDYPSKSIDSFLRLRVIVTRR